MAPSGEAEEAGEPARSRRSATKRSPSPRGLAAQRSSGGRRRPQARAWGRRRAARPERGLQWGREHAAPGRRCSPTPPSHAAAPRRSPAGAEPRGAHLRLASQPRRPRGPGPVAPRRAALPRRALLDYSRYPEIRERGRKAGRILGHHGELCAKWAGAGLVGYATEGSFLVKRDGTLERGTAEPALEISASTTFCPEIQNPELGRPKYPRSRI